MLSIRSTLLLFVIALAPLTTIAKEPVKNQIGQFVLEDVPPIDAALRERLMQYLEVRRAGLLDLSDDGKSLLIATRFGGSTQLHTVAQPLGARKQITFADEPIDSGYFVPGSDSRKVIYAKDKGGDENDNYFVLDLNEGRSTLITDGKSRHSNSVISKSGRWFAVSGTARNGRDFDVYLKDLTSNDPPKMIWEVKGQYYVAGFSPDEKSLLINHYISERETEWFIVDLADFKQRRITPETPAAYYGDAAWSHDGKTLFLTTDREGEFRRLYRLELETGAWTCLTPTLNWDVESVAVEPTGAGLAYVVNEDGISRLVLCDTAGKNERTVKGLPVGVIGGLQFNQAGGTLGLTINSSKSPSDAYSVDFAAGNATRWTESEIGGLNAERFVEPELIRYPTFDQVDGKPRMIPAFLYRGVGDGPRPVIIQCHGGPEGQFTPGFTSPFQFWARELGISVLALNVRGSVGYGRTYHQIDNGVLREDAVKDVGAALDWIAKQPHLDASRVGIFGGSYGGYMVLGSLTNFPDRITAGIDIVGIASFVSFLETTPEFRRDLRRAEYGDERDPAVRAVLEKISPLSNAEKIKAALFVMHGENDPRVPVSEARQIVAKMRALGRTVWFANALNEGHGFAKKENSDLAAVMQAMFWKEHLLK
ncbi:MAG: prolyl oligopeptidase family serine peptidase [Phycisphaerae bacterium]|nr:prolyl oligopeptidase family serine peptidase [Phycisphaerae bacterium]